MLTINTNRKRFVLKEDDEICEKIFKRIIGMLIGEEDGDENLESSKGIMTPENDVKRIEPKSAQVHREYKGFLYIKCPECGNEKGQCSAKGMHSIHCDECGCNDEFAEPLIPMWVNCECGKRFRYMTNIKTDMFDMTCLECGSPVPVKYNEKKNVYETIPSN